MPRRKLNIIIVEDSAEETALLKSMLSKMGVTDPVTFVRNGSEAVECLQNKELAKHNLLFKLLVIDLNMPGMNGVDLLKWLHENPIPTLIAKVVLTSSQNPAQLQMAYALGAAGIFRKPSSHQQLGTLLRRIYDYWSISEMLPSQPFQRIYELD